MMNRMKKAISFFMAVCLLAGNSYVDTTANTSVTMSDWTQVSEPREPLLPKGLLTYLESNVGKTASAATDDAGGYVFYNPSAGSGEVVRTGDEVTISGSTLFLLTKVAFAVEVDSSENTIKNCIGAFNSSQGFTDLITEIGSILIFQEVIKGIFVFESERKVFNLSFQTDTFIFLFKVINAFGISIAKILDEKHGKDIIFVIGGVNVISESICSRPQSSFNIIKRGLSHYIFLQRFLRIF